MEGAIFDNLENEVIYHDSNDDMVKLVMRLWDAADPAKKWEMLHYDIKNGTFAVEYFYPDQLDPEEGSPDHRERALAKRFGDKTVIYPEPSSGNWNDLGADELQDGETGPV